MPSKQLIDGSFQRQECPTRVRSEERVLHLIPWSEFPPRTMPGSGLTLSGVAPFALMLVKVAEAYCGLQLGHSRILTTGDFDRV